MRKPSNIFVCQTNFYDAYTILKSNKHERLCYYSDAIELLRQNYFKTRQIDEHFMGNITENIEFSDQYLYRLKLKLIVFSIMSGYYHRVNERIHLEYLSIFNSFQKIIEVQIACKNLKILHNIHSSKPLSKIEACSSKCLRLFIMDYLKIEFIDDFKIIKDSLRPRLDGLIMSTRYVENYEQEACLLCNSIIAPDELKCPDKHAVERCMFSQIQVPFFKSKYCKVCNRQSTDYDDLNNIFHTNANVMYCIFCDSKLKT